MIIFKKLRYKNLMGAGNAPIEIILNEHQKTLIIGSNGSGKSSSMEALTFGLFGKPFRDIKKAQLINTVNLKQCLVEVWFDIGKKQYMIKRGMKPDVFEIHCDDVLLKQVADVREHQRMLEEQILHMNSKTFMQVVLLSFVNFKPFMQLEAKERRDVIEEVLDIKVFSAMNKILSGRASTLRETASAIDGNISVAKQKVEIQLKYIETLSADNDAKAAEIQLNIDKAHENIDILEDNVTIFTNNMNLLYETVDDESSVHTRKLKLSPIVMPLQAKLEKLKDIVDFYTHADVCPTCSQNINEDIKQEQIHQQTDKQQEIIRAIDKLTLQIADIKERESEINKVKLEINSISAEIQKANAHIIGEQNYIKKLNNELNMMAKTQGNIENEKKKHKDLEKGKDLMLEKKAELSEQKQYIDIASSLLKDSGIKTRIIDQYIPVINKLINKYLDVMDLWISFHLDAEFNETVKSRHRDTFSYYSFSEGEKQRIDLAILFTWRTIAKMKNSVSCNLLVLDEILDKCLDEAGMDYVVQLLDTLGEGSNIFVVSHKVEQLQDKFEHKLCFEKVNNFSQIATST